MKRNFAFSSQYRIHNSKEFGRILKEGIKLWQAHLCLCFVPNDVSYLRLGTSINKRFGQAHQRNRWKRLIREAFRISPLRYSKGLDIVVFPSQRNKSWEWNTLKEELHLAISKAIERSRTIPADCSGR